MTQAEIQTLRDAYMAAEVAILSGQSYTIGGRQLSRTNLLWVQNERKLLDAQLTQVIANVSSAPRVVRIVPR